jgi:Holliday junction resolvasome RuvABC ATP-dependent DNA helicase subunit
MGLIILFTIIGLGLYGLFIGAIKLTGKILIPKNDSEEILQQVLSGKMEYIHSETFDKPQTIILKDPQFDSTKINTYELPVKQFEFRPKTWTQFIGQTNGKEQAKIIIEKARRGIRCHCILSAIRGHGKTTFIELLAKSLDAHLIERVGKQLDEDELLNVVNEINESSTSHVVFFLDEIDTTDWKVLKILNPLIEQFAINGKQIKPFIFCSATINKDTLIKNNPDLLDRIPHHIQFTRYNADDITKIITQYASKLYEKEIVPIDVIKIISTQCQFNPRTSISLLEDYIIVKDINKVLRNRRIIKDGLTDIDVRILDILNSSTRAIGANALAMKAGLTQNQYLREYEPFLVEFGYINRIPSRILSEKGKQYLQTVKE